ncbi:MAG: dihydrofolate reductase family protein [Nocardioides sp.]
MTFTTCHVSMSLDGYLAGLGQTFETPLGVGAECLHLWMFPPEGETPHEADLAAREHLAKDRGAYVMGRNMFGPVRDGWRTWDGEWRGWWGDEPPYHAPVFVLTHHEHEPIEMEGGTTFHFVTDGFDTAYARAVEAAGDREILIAGGASTIRQAFRAGVLDEIVLDVSPVLLGAGERLLDGVDDPGLTPVEVLASPQATHIRYRVGAA